MTNYIKYTFRSIAALFVLLALTFTTACEEEEMGTSEVQLLSFGPAGVKHGEEVVFIGTNLDKIASIVFRPSVEVTKDVFTSQNSSQIKLNVPDAAEAGFVTLKTTDGDTLQTKTMLNFDVPVVLSNMTTKAKPGTNVTITGQKLNWIEEITFPADVVVSKDDFVSQSLTELVVEVPMEAQTGFLIFASGGTEPMTFATESQLEVTLPSVTGLSPSSIKHTGDLTIQGTDLDLVTEVVLPDGVSLMKSDFKSHSGSEIVVTVPATVVNGTITLKQASPVDVTTTQELSIILPVGTSLSPAPAVPGEDEITITGTDLDLIAELTFAGAGSVSDFASQTATEIVVAVPAEATLGPIGYVTIHGYSDGLGLVLTIPSDGPPPLIVPLYEDAVTSLGAQGGGWSSTTDFASTENAREGSNSMKVTYTGSWGGGAQIGTWGQSPISVSGTEVLAFSIFGTEGTGGQQIQVLVKDGAGNEYANMVDIVANTWTDIEIPLEDLGNLTDFSEIFFQNTDQWQGTVYIDRLGFSLAGGPPELLVVMYDDAATSIVGQGGGWTATTDWASTDNTRQGTNAIKVTFAGGYGGAAQFGTWGMDPFSVSGTSVFAFSIFGSDVADNSIQVLVKDDAGGEYTAQVNITGGEWQDIEIPLSELGSITAVSEVFFQDLDWSGTVYIDYVGFR